MPAKRKTATKGKSARPKKKKPATRKQVEAAKSPPKKKGGRPAKRTKKEAGQRQREASARFRQARSQSTREIAGEDWDGLIRGIDWTRRLGTRWDLLAFNEAYLPNIFYLPWSVDQRRCIQKMETVIIDDGMFAIAQPRAGGKTAIVRGGITAAITNAHKRFPYNIGSTDPKAVQTLQAIKTFFYSSPELYQDFPELCWAIRQTDNQNRLAGGQLFYSQQTYIKWGNESLRFPCLLLPKKDADWFLRPRIDGKRKSLREEDEPVYWLDSRQSYVSKSAGINFMTAGITGSIRGEAETHPVTLEQPRPDLAILDDIQKDQAADSPAQCDKLVTLIDGAILGLAGPGGHISVIMPCTVTREGDVSDTYLDHDKKPEYRGERGRLVESWPEGITDTQISLETEPGRLWDRYGELRRESFRQFETHSRDCEHCRDNLLDPCPEGLKIKNAPTRHYVENRDAMDDGFIVNWEGRYGNPKLVGGKVVRKDAGEISAQQHAMNLRCKAPLTFPAEYQNRGRSLVAEDTVVVTARQLMEKVIDCPRDHVPADVQHLVAFIDVQNEMLFYGILGVSPAFNGVFCRYGSWPEVNTRYFTKGQTEGWSLLTREFFQAYPHLRENAAKTEGGKLRAPLEAKIYHALGLCVRHIKSLPIVRQDQHQTQLSIKRIGIDARWGQASDAIKRFCRECGHPEVLPYKGFSVPPTHRQFEEYTRTKGWLFESQVNPLVKEDKWIFQPELGSGQFYIKADVDRLKTFLMARLASPPGAQGSIALHAAAPDTHEMFARQVCDSEYPETVEARGMKKDKWLARDGRPDNEYLDIAAGCLALASLCGVSLRTGNTNPPQRKRRSLRDKYNAKRRGRR